MNSTYPVILACCLVAVVRALPASESDLAPVIEQDGTEDAPKTADAYSTLRRAYRLTFLPIRTMLYGYLRSFMRRFRRRRNKHRGRSLDMNFEDKEKCNLNHLGRWVDKENPCRFYECAMNFTAIEKCLSRQNAVEDESQIYRNTITQHSNQIKRELVESKKSKSIQHSTFFPINDCVSLVRHQCKDNFIYSTLKQSCVPINTVPQECMK
nr:PREDICTED: uncharacterized protein LOC109037393 isoform X1 [Bemisia tabaci]